MNLLEHKMCMVSIKSKFSKSSICMNHDKLPSKVTLGLVCIIYKNEFTELAKKYIYTQSPWTAGRGVQDGGLEGPRAASRARGTGNQQPGRGERTRENRPTVSTRHPLFRVQDFLAYIHVIKGSLLDFFKCVHVEPRRQEGSRREAATPGDLPRVARKKASS